MLGLYYLICMPGSVRKQLQQVMDDDGGDDDDDDNGSFEAKFQLLFTLGFVPGIFLPFVTGAVVDRIGTSACLLGLSTTCFAGQSIAAIGVQRSNWPWLLTGRLVFGIGFESLFVANEAFLSVVFRDRVGMALGVSTAASFVGFLLSPILSPIAATQISVAFSFWLGAMIMGVATLASGIIWAIVPNKAAGAKSCSGRGRVTPSPELAESGENYIYTTGVSATNDTTRDNVSIRSNPQLSHVCQFPTSFWLLCIACSLVYGVTTSFMGAASGLFLEQYLFVEPPDDCLLLHPGNCTSGYLAPADGNPSFDASGQHCPMTDRFAPVLPWSINETHHDGVRYDFPDLESSQVDCTDTDNFWTDACTPDYCDALDEATRQAGIWMALPFVVTVLTTFAFGHWLVDRAHLRVPMIALGPLLLLVSHALLAAGGSAVSSAILPLIIMGLGFSIFVSAIWPSIPLSGVPPETVGTAIGVMTCVQAVGNAIAPLIVMAIYNHTGERYAPNVELFFVACTLVVVVIGSALLWMDQGGLDIGTTE